MTDKNKKLTKEEKIQKAVNLLKEVVSLELSDEEVSAVAGGMVHTDKEQLNPAWLALNWDPPQLPDESIKC